VALQIRHALTTVSFVANFYSLMGEVDWLPILKAFTAYEWLMNEINVNDINYRMPILKDFIAYEWLIN
jgi:hypothetical protein